MDVTDEARSQSRLSLAALGQWLALVVGLAAALFPFGLVLLWLQIRNTYTDDAAIAWYASGLPSRTFILGHGVAAIAQTLLQSRITMVGIVAITMMIVFLAIRIHRDPRSPEEIREERLNKTMENIERFGPPTPILSGLLGFWIGSRRSLALFLLFVLIMVTNWAVQIFLLGDIAAPISSIVLVLGASVGILFWGNRYYYAREGRPSGPFWFVPSLLIIYFSAVISALIHPGLGDPSLPTIRLNPEGERPPIEGTFLAHTNGYWHLFDADGRLVAIPENLAGTVEIVAED